MSRVKLLLFFVFGMVCIVSWTNYFMTVSTHQPTLVVENYKDLGAIPEGSIKVAFEIFNSSPNQSRTVLNVCKNCTAAGCVTVDDWEDQPITIAPQETLTLVCNVAVRETGPFELTLPVFVDDGGMKEILFVVRGTSVAIAATPLQQFSEK